MKKLTLFICLILSAAGVSAQQTIQSDNVQPFSSISLQGSISAQLIPSVTNAIDIVLYDSEITKLKWTVSDGKLSVILRPSGKGRGSADVKIYYADTLTNINISASQLTADEPVTGKMLRFVLSGGASATLSCDVIDMELEATGNSAAVISGRAKYLAVKATEKSKIDTRETETTAADVDTATGAEVYVQARERLVATARTSSTIFYKGQPDILRDRTGRINLGASVLNIGN